MAYIGLQPQTKVLATSTQKLNGTGGDFEYALNRAVSKAADLRVFVGNVALRPEIDYTASGTQLLFTSQPAAGTDNININYVAGALTALTLTASSYPQGTTVNPSIRYSDGTSTGIWFPSTTSVGITTSGNTRVTVIDSPTATSTTSGALRVTGGVGVTGALYVGDSVRFTSTTESTTSADGALVVSGGVGVAKSLNVQGSLNVSGDFTVAGAFTTTSADSLVLNDPFLFLANANPGDALDTGIVSSYNDGIQRFTGLFRDITDGKYKLFDNLDVSPTTVVDTGDTSFQFSDLKLGILEVSDSTASTTSSSGALIVTGGIGVGGAIFVNSINNAIAIGNGGTSGVGNIGSSGATFNTAFIKSTSAQYADVAEKYASDRDYEPGTVLHFGGTAEVSQCDVDMCSRVAGVVSTQPAYLMNDAIQGEHVVSLALLGRVPCKVVGPITKGDMLVSAGDGRARAEHIPQIGSVIGKALEDFNGDHGVIEVVVGRV
jgi:hypothetical protein